MATDRELVNEHEASKIIGFKLTTLRKRRIFGKPPKFYKVGTKVFYDKFDLERYLDSCLREPKVED